MKKYIEESDLLKVYDVLNKLVLFHKLRDEMNATLHLGETRYSALTANAMVELERLEQLVISFSKVRVYSNKAVCLIKGCGKRVHSKGMCQAHYRRKRRKLN